MSESLLDALMQLFAIVAEVDGLNDNSRSTVKSFLEEELAASWVEKYLARYDEYIQHHHFRRTKKDGRIKRTSRNSVKILRIAKEINESLVKTQKLVVLIRLIEYLHVQNIQTEQNDEFLQTISDSFHIDEGEFKLLCKFIGLDQGDCIESETFLGLGPIERCDQRVYKNDHLQAELLFVRLQHSKTIAFRMLGQQELFHNGQLIREGKLYFFRQGDSIRSPLITPIYHSDILSRYTHDHLETPVVLSAHEISYSFRPGQIGLHPLSFSASSGEVVGIMGGSGTGKSTLLNVLNGNYPPTTGYIEVNGLDLYENPKDLQGFVGYVPQDDLLMEDLTVYQNLFYNAHLSFGKESNEEIVRRVKVLLKSLGLYEVKDLKVGSPLEKTISGGQRKRLNIALELIREPPILFVDEPTSGLSSRDSENIMDLLKELSLKGKLIFVVIHQPSSEIFKLFDRLLILDRGGYLVYQGNPLDGVAYFKNQSNQVPSGHGYHGTEQVNPEQIFDVLEARVIDEFGSFTEERRKSPLDWNRLYKEHLEPYIKIPNIPKKIPSMDFSIPGWVKQFRIFTIRDLLSKLSNRQYLFINLLEAPVLALIIAGFLRYHTSLGWDGQGYIYRENDNILAYLFISVVVALFLGLSVSAEEIIKDRKIRRRESFLNLSKGGYLLSKVLILFGLSAIQILTYVWIGNFLLGIQDMYLDYWIVLFSAAAFANVLGLNLSSAFRKTVTVYILIPFIIIPQILFSGVIVKYEKLNPMLASHHYVPFVGEMMASRWIFEALAVHQVKNNRFEAEYFKLRKKLYYANYRRNYWIPAIESAISRMEQNKTETTGAIWKRSAKLIYNEMSKLPEKERTHYKGTLIHFHTGDVSIDELNTLKIFIQVLEGYYVRLLKKSESRQDAITEKLKSRHGGDEGYRKFRDQYENQQLAEFINNKNDLKRLVEVNDHIIRKENKLYEDPRHFRSHYYASQKLFMGEYYPTYYYNISVIWLVTLILMLALYFDLLPGLISWGSGQWRKR
ncbi:ATP-binding cassette domain-containing protein [bacterium SCSIO 12741]|nr:ATP-binding cassette domain-containing protein [bacterium SCSIO 12741]